MGATMNAQTDEDRQFAEYAAKRAREDREREAGHQECPKCSSLNTVDGYGLAAGNLGPYTICMNCGHVLWSTPDPEMQAQRATPPAEVK